MRYPSPAITLKEQYRIVLWAYTSFTVIFIMGVLAVFLICWRLDARRLLDTQKSVPTIQDTVRYRPTSYTDLSVFEGRKRKK